MADIIQFVPRSVPKPVTITIWPEVSPLECMAIDIVNEIFPSGDTAQSEYSALEEGPA